MTTNKILFTMLSILFCLTLQAQNFVEQTDSNNLFDGLDSGNYSTPTFADFDNDGDLDLITGGTDGTFKYYQNKDVGTNIFIQLTGSASPFGALDIGGYSSATFKDMDNDGDLDLIGGGTNGVIMYYLNAGTHFYQPTVANNIFNGIDVGDYATPTLVDLDNDGDLDLISGNFEGTFYYYTNNGNNVFTRQVGANNPFNGIDSGVKSHPTFADLDKDGDLDLISGEKNGTFKYYKNDGTLSVQAENLLKNNLSIYPNPTTTNLNIELSSTIENIAIFNLLGEKVNFKVLNSRKLDVSNLSKGIYILKVENEDGNIFIKRFVRE